MITDYDSLKAEIANFTARDDLTGYIPTFIDHCERRLSRDLRIRQMETVLSVVISGGVAAIPAGYLEAKNIYLDSSPAVKLRRTDLSNLYAMFPNRSESGKPGYFAVDGSNFVFGPAPDSDYTVKGTYYAAIARLSASNTSNWFITDASDLLLYGSMSEAALFMENDNDFQKYEGLYMRAKAQVEAQDLRQQFSGSAIKTNALGGV